MKTFFTYLLLAFLSTTAVAQSTSYKKIMAEKDAVELSVFFAHLKEFQTENQAFSNVYYQLGKIELENFSNLDPIVDRIAARQYVHNTKTNFGLAKNYLDQNEVNKNPEWYDVPSMKQKDSIVILVTTKMDENYDASVQHAQAYEELIFHYDKAVTHYLEAQKDFININTSADNLRQLFLQTDDSLKLAIREVGISFDSSMHHLDKYRETYQALPHPKKRKVIVNFNHIEHFRMNGITPTNFLADYIDVWDYKLWSEEFLNLIKIEVDGLQDEIRTAYQFFQNSNNRLMTGTECTQVAVDDRQFQRIINLVTKYDNQSILIDIFQYILYKFQYGNDINYERNCNISNETPTDIFLSRKARIYQDLFASFKVADSLDNSITTSGHSQDTFEWFFSEMMNSPNGSADFANDQLVENRQAFKTEVSNLAILGRNQKFQTDSISETYGRADTLLLKIKSPENTDSLLVVKGLKLSDSLNLLLVKDQKGMNVIGASQNENGFAVLWEHAALKNSDINFFKLVTDASFVIAGDSWFKHITFTGGLQKTVTLKSKDPIVHISYNDLQGSFTVLQSNGEKQIYSTIGSNGKVTSSKSLVLPGEFLNMWKQEGQLLFFTSSDQEEKTVITNSVFDPSTSQLNEIATYTLSYPIVESILIKNDNQSITLLSKNSLDPTEVLYAVLDYNGNIHYEEIF